MNQSKAEKIVAQLLTNAASLRYGCVAVSVKLHDGRVVSVSYTTTEQTVEPAAKRVPTSEGSPPVQETKKGKN